MVKALVFVFACSTSFPACFLALSGVFAVFSGDFFILEAVVYFFEEVLISSVALDFLTGVVLVREAFIASFFSIYVFLTGVVVLEIGFFFLLGEASAFFFVFVVITSPSSSSRKRSAG